MQLRRAGLTLGFAFLVGCGGTVTREGEPLGGAGSGGNGASAGSVGDFGGLGGSIARGGTGNGGDASDGAYGNYGGEIFYTGGYGGVVSYGGNGANGGGVSFAGQGGSCGPTTSASGPYPVNFEFSSNTPVYLQQDCSLTYSLYSCSSDQNPINRSAACVADCNDTSSGCLACGACFSGVKLVQPGAPVVDSWGGKIYKYGTLPSGCACASGANAAPGVYRIVISAFLSAADAMAGTNPYVHTVWFQLPAANGAVPIDLGFLAL